MTLRMTAFWALLAAVVWPGQSLAFETTARAAVVIDQSTGTVLLDKDGDLPLPPASMSKLMTLYVTFEALRRGQLRMKDKLSVSEHAMSYRGSTMFLDTTDKVTVEDLVRGIIVLSGNDACVVLAEALSPDGTEAGFARLMTQRARDLGMTQSNFVNSNGWPAIDQRMSMRDLAILAQRLIEDFPEYYPMFAETEFEFDGRAPSNTQNRNPILRLGIGADGLKTGHTREAGYGLVGSAIQGNRRVIFAFTGLDTARARAQEAEAIVNWSMRHFEARLLAPAGQPIAHADIWMGKQPQVSLMPAEDLTVLLPVLMDKTVTAEVEYRGPIQAPVAAGDHLADLVVQPENLPEIRLPLVASQDVPVGGFMVRVGTAAQVLMRQFLAPSAS
ncbi:MAG: D-alanyl-D-alanine carboxypeptidase [Rhodobacteraceae bacterium]|nr:D-alanyl-D-alanine carboxypeptidase [Paracoccaceae bacterium]